MRTSQEIKNLAAALASFQVEMEPVKKEATNPFLKSKYADLSSIIEAIRVPLAKNGLSFTQFPSGDNGLSTLLMHTSGEWIEDTYRMAPVDAKPQSVGSAITYMRRYALSAVLGLATEDDDGHAASTSAKRVEKPTHAPTVSAPAAQPKTDWLLEIQTAKSIQYLEEIAQSIAADKALTAERKTMLRGAWTAKKDAIAMEILGAKSN